MLLGDVEMEIRSSDVSLSFLLALRPTLRQPIPFSPVTYETAPENAFCFLLKSTLGNPWSYWSRGFFHLFYAQSVSGEEIIPDFWIMKSQAQNKREWEAVRDRILWVLSLDRTLQIRGETGSLHCSLHTVLQLSSVWKQIAALQKKW